MAGRWTTALQGASDRLGAVVTGAGAALAFPLFLGLFGWLTRYTVENAPTAVAVAVLVVNGGILGGLLFLISIEKRRRTLLGRLGRVNVPLAAVLFPVGLFVSMLYYFAGLTFVLVDEGWVSFAPNAPEAEMTGRLTDFFIYRFAEFFPGLELADTLKLSSPLKYEQTSVGGLVVAFQVLVIAPIIATFRTYWKMRAGGGRVVPVPVTPGSFHERLAHHGGEGLLAEGIEHLDPATIGLPTVAPATLLRALLCMTHDGTSDQESARRTRVDADWRAAMLVADDFAGIDATTLAVSRMRMLVNTDDALRFTAVLLAATGLGIFTDAPDQVLASSAVGGADAVDAACRLLSMLLDQVTAPTDGARHEGGAAAAETSEAADATQGRARFAALVTQARAVVAELGPHGSPGVADPVALLAAVVADHDAGQVRPERRSGTPTA